jgi:hypothetical protein
MRRMQILDGRIQEIEVEKEALLRGLNESGASRHGGRMVTPQSAMRRSAGTNSFKLKY